MTTPSLTARIEAYIKQYVSFDNNDYSLAAALWLFMTYFWHEIDAVPYVIITSGTKRAGKSRFAEVLSFVSRNSRNMTAVSTAMIYRTIQKEYPTQYYDESENMTSESASDLRSVLNSGNRRGQTVPRMQTGGKIIDFPTYCPKVFILIGDMFDTVRDRSIIFRMVRSAQAPRMTHSIALAEGKELAEEIQQTVEARMSDIRNAYLSHDGLPFLGDRDEEMWLPLFIACQVFAPDRITDLQRIAADMCAEKTDEARSYVKLLKTDEASADQDEYTRRLLTDLLSTFRDDEKTMGHANRNSGYVSTADALERLHELPTGPWRKFRGPGLTAADLSNMLRVVGVKPQYIRPGTGKKVFRGYRKADVERAVKEHCL